MTEVGGAITRAGTVETWTPPVELDTGEQPGDGLRCWQGPAARMPGAHRHNDVELNYVESVTMSYLFGGDPVDVPAGTLTVFWAAKPHQLVSSAATSAHWVVVGLERFLGWHLPGAFVGRVLQGPPLVLHTTVSLPEPFQRWQADLASGESYDRGSAALEIEAFVRRLARGAGPRAARADPADNVAVLRAAAMAHYISRHLAEPITVDLVAGAATVSAPYAMSLFHAVVGSTIGGYLTQCRVAEAQRLLLTTDLPLIEVGDAVGFRSQSTFYSSFREVCRTSPGRYRRAHARR